MGLLNDDLMLTDESDDEKVSYIVLYYVQSVNTRDY